MLGADAPHRAASGAAGRRTHCRHSSAGQRRRSFAEPVGGGVAISFDNPERCPEPDGITEAVSVALRQPIVFG